MNEKPSKKMRKDTTKSHYLRKIVRLSRVNQNGCWVWQGYKNKLGYGRMNFRGKVRYTHRIIMELIGEIKNESLVVDHVCRNSSCCNPNHLRMVTQQTNSIENSESIPAANAKKTHCKRGHEFTEENTYRFASFKGRRLCKICRNKQTVTSRRKNLQSTV